MEPAQQLVLILGLQLLGIHFWFARSLAVILVKFFTLMELVRIPVLFH